MFGLGSRRRSVAAHWKDDAERAWIDAERARAEVGEMIRAYDGMRRQLATTRDALRNEQHRVARLRNQVEDQAARLVDLQEERDRLGAELVRAPLILIPDNGNYGVPDVFGKVCGPHRVINCSRCPAAHNPSYAAPTGQVVDEFHRHVMDEVAPAQQWAAAVCPDAGTGDHDCATHGHQVPATYGGTVGDGSPEDLYQRGAFDGVTGADPLAGVCRCAPRGSAAEGELCPIHD